MFKKPFVVLDLETSGMDPRRDDIIEIAMVRYENGKEVARLIPPVGDAKEIDLKEVISSFHEIRQQISGRVNIPELIEEGRRF